MKNISNAVFSITYTDGSVKSKSLENFVFNDGNLVTRLNLEKMGNCELVLLGGDHMIYEQKPAECGNIIKEFVDKLSDN